MQFILNEVINDMGIQKGTIWDWTRTVLLATFCFELRMIIHYVGQWVFLKLVNCPVISIEWQFFEIRMDYAFWLME